MIVTRRAALRAALAAAAVMLVPACDANGVSAPTNDGATLRSTFFAFNTVCVIGGDVSRTALDAATDRCMAFERLLSRTIATSDVARVNAAAGATVTVEAATAELVAAALAYRDASGGSFDITIGAVSELWDFTTGVVPTAAAIERALPHVGCDVAVDLAASTVTLADPAARIDLGGIAKGYVADAVVAELAEAGATSAYVNLGGNVAVLGARPDGGPWSVGVRDPFADLADDATAALVARIDVIDGSVVTSGLYERSFEQDGRRYWHILDPRTGYPVTTDLASVTVAATRSLDGDGLTKTPFFLGAGAGLAFLAEQGAEGLVVAASGEVSATEGSGFVRV